MNDNVVPSLKLVFKPLIMYYGEWEILDGLKDISLSKKDKNMFDEFLNRYYYMPLTVIFKDEELAKSYKWAICSRLGSNGRSLYFSKKAFLRNVISNANEVVDSGGENVFKEVKKAIRDRKDIYRDVYNNGKESEYYKMIKKEYVNFELDLTFDEYVALCKKKYTKLLTGYNAVLDLFDKAINVDKFIECFDPNQLYLYTAYSVLQHSKKHFEEYGNADYNIIVLDTYQKLVDGIRKKDTFYNSHIILNGNVVYTIDDLFKEYETFMKMVDGK